MKISPISLINKNNFKIKFTSSDKDKQDKSEDIMVRKDILPYVPNFMFPGIIIRNKIYSKETLPYNPIASIRPIKSYIHNYDDLDKFSKLYSEKINSQLLAPSEEDIEKLILRIQKSTKASKTQIREVLYNLTLFSSYKAFDILNEITEKEDIKEFGFIDRSQKKNYPEDFSSNSAFDYLINKKRFIDTKSGTKQAYVLDNISLKQLEMYKNSSNEREKEIYQKFLENIKLDNVVFLSIKGWDIKTINNGYKSANMFSGTGYLEELAVEVIKRINNKENPKKIYYSDFKERLLNILDDEDLKEHIKIVDIEKDAKKITNKNILDNIKPPVMSDKYVKAFITSYIDAKSLKFPKEKVQEALLKYLDELTNVYSIDSLSLALKKMNRTIESILAREGYKKDDIIYAVPESAKSYSLITLMYCQINDINPKNIRPIFDIREEDKYKAKVILDDLSASGTSESKTTFYYRMNYKHDRNTFCYAPVIMCSMAESPHERAYGTSIPDEYCFDKYINDMTSVNELSEILKEGIFSSNLSYLQDSLDMLIGKRYKLLNLEDIKILSDVLYSGYSSNALCVLFPYMIPDNSSDLASLLFSTLLYKDNSQTNKLFTYLSNKQTVRQQEFKMYNEIKNKARSIVASQ